MPVVVTYREPSGDSMQWRGAEVTLHWSLEGRLAVRAWPAVSAH